MSGTTNAIKPGFPGVSRIEATPDGITFAALNDEGAFLQPRLLGYSSVIRQLDEGGFDTALHDGLFIIAEICRAGVNGWLSLSNEKMVIIWRWLVACVFVCEHWVKSGLVDVENESGGVDKAVIYTGQHGGMAIYPLTERCSLAVNVEGVAIEKYGVESGIERAILFYQGMIETDPDGGTFTLSTFGRDTLTTLHDDFIKTLNAEGLPAQPTAH